jgi:hypothetical protein
VAEKKRNKKVSTFETQDGDPQGRRGAWMKRRQTEPDNEAVAQRSEDRILFGA